MARAVTAAKLARDEARSLFHITTSAILELAASEVVFSKDHRGDEAGGGEDGRWSFLSSLPPSSLRFRVLFQMVKSAHATSEP